MEKIMKILLIDDEESTLRAFENVLLLNGFDCFATSDIELGLTTYQKTCFDFVLLDYQMPYKNGIEVMSEILSMNLTANVIIYTGHTDTSIKQTAIVKGAFEFLYKPIDFKELLNMLINSNQHILELETI